MDDSSGGDLELSLDDALTDDTVADEVPGGGPGGGAPAGRRATRWIAARWVAAALAAVGAVAATGVALRPAPPLPPTGAALSGLSIEVALAQPAGPGAAAPAAGRITATYRVGTDPAAGRVVVESVSGPFLGPSSVRGSMAGTTARSGGGGESVAVSATPDCRDARSLDPAPSPYRVTLRRTDPAGRTARGVLVLPDSPANWAAAVRQDCWQTVGAALRVEAVTADPSRHPGRLDVTVVLRSALTRDVGIGVVDIANVATTDAADAGPLPAGTRRAYRVRLPVTGCTPAAGVALTWAVGPVGTDPVTLVATPLTPDQLAVIDAAARRSCRAAPRGGPSDGA